MAKPDFTDAEARLNRASDHIADAEAAIERFLSTDFYSLRLEPIKGSSEIKVVFKSLHEPDRRINAVIGDAIGNLRSVLDYVAVALVHPITGNTDQTGFPFADDVHGFTGQVRAAKGLGPCAAAVHDHFVNNVQAYQGGKGESLWILNKLRNTDKHRLLIASVNLAGIIVSFRVGTNFFTDMGLEIVEGGGANIIRMPGSMDFEFTNEPRPTFEIRINEPPYVEKASLIPFLKGLSGDVKSFLDTLKVIV